MLSATPIIWECGSALFTYPRPASLPIIKPGLSIRVYNDVGICYGCGAITCRITVDPSKPFHSHGRLCEFCAPDWSLWIPYLYFDAYAQLAPHEVLAHDFQIAARNPAVLSNLATWETLKNARTN